MIDTFKEVETIEDWDGKRAKLGELLGLSEAVPCAVLRRAIADRHYAAYLANTRHSPQLLQVLFDAPKTRAFEQPSDVEPLSSFDLVRKASASFLEWARAGAPRIDSETFERRFSACEGCEYLGPAPDRLVYRVRLRRGSDTRICTKCGCPAAAKARRPTERCPAVDPKNPTLTRWGEPAVAAAHAL
ncbi:MAG: hypothetical protein WCE44_10830 [Candidatus Velthaea sp.]